MEAMNTKYDQLDERKDTDTQANVSTKIFIYRENGKQEKQSEKGTQTGEDTYRWAGRQIDGQTGRQTHRWTDRQTDRG